MDKLQYPVIVSKIGTPLIEACLSNAKPVMATAEVSNTMSFIPAAEVLPLQQLANTPAIDRAEADEAASQDKPGALLLDMALEIKSGEKNDDMNHLSDQHRNTSLFVISIRIGESVVLIPIQVSFLVFLLRNFFSRKAINKTRHANQEQCMMLSLDANQILWFYKKQNQRGDKYNLTPREKEILQVMSLGLSQKEIAAKFFIETTTVNTHVQNIYKKLETHNASGSVAKALRAGIIE